MMILTILKTLIVIHVALGIVQMIVSYYAGDIVDHGAQGFVSHTPIGSFVDLDETPQTQQASLTDIRGMFQVLNRAGDAINGLASLNYGFMSLIESDDGLVYNVVVFFRLASVLAVLYLGFAVLYFLFDSNMLTSKTGLAILAFGAGLGGLSTLGALVG